MTQAKGLPPDLLGELVDRQLQLTERKDLLAFGRTFNGLLRSPSFPVMRASWTTLGSDQRVEGTASQGYTGGFQWCLWWSVMSFEMACLLGLVSIKASWCLIPCGFPKGSEEWRLAGHLLMTCHLRFLSNREYVVCSFCNKGCFWGCHKWWSKAKGGHQRLLEIKTS